MLADALVIETGEQEDHWNASAKTVLLGLLVHVCTHPDFEGRRNLITVRNFLQVNHTEFANALFTMSKNEIHGGVAAGIAKQLAGTPGNELGSILSCTRRHLSFIASPGLSAVLETSTFDLTQMKSELMSVFLVLPAKYLSSHGRWLRMMVTIAMLSATDEGIKPPDPPIVWMLDELAQLGYLKPVADGYSLLRGYGFRIWGIFQNLNRMKQVYNDHAGSMLSASVVQGFNIEDEETAEWFSIAAGKQKVGGFGSEEPRLQSIIREDEVRFLDEDTQIIKLPKERAFTCKKLYSWRDQEFKLLLDKDPYH
jgi:type IV secretion system protein VirD4